MVERILTFDVDRQRLTRSRRCDFSHIVANSRGYLKARFYFSTEWVGCHKVATFSYNGTEESVMLDKYDKCEIPANVLTGDHFYVKVLGGKNDFRIESSKIKVMQEVT